jgi:APA family basic amino acid/polyamine antiporter
MATGHTGLFLYLSLVSTGGSHTKIGFTSAVALIVGSIIGSGVFMKPATMAAQLGSPVWLTLVWVLAGLFSLFGALIYAELGAMMPRSGGMYVYFRRIFGDFTAFLYGWAAFAVINTAAVASISFVCAYYLDFFIGLPEFSDETVRRFVWHLPALGDLYPLKDAGVKGLAAFLCLTLTWINARSLRAGDRLQVISTFVKIAVLLLLVLGIFGSGEGSVRNFYQADHSLTGASLLGGIVAALTGAFMAFDGWINVTAMAGEIREPGRNLPRSLFTGVLVCTGIYILVNQAYLFALPVERMAGSALVASDAIQVALGHTAEALVAALIVICTMGAINGNVMACARITYAMGRDRLFSSWAGADHPRFQTPANALWLHGVWTCLFIFSGTFDMLADMFVFISWIAYGMGAVGILILRRRLPQADRPYRIWGHPFVTFLFIAFAGFYLVSTLVNDVANYLHGRQPVVNSVLGLLITALGIPLYIYFRRRNGRSTSKP